MRTRRLFLAILLVLLHQASLAQARGGDAAGSPQQLRQVLSMCDAQKACLPPEVKEQAIRKFGLRAVALSNDFVAGHSRDYNCLIPGEDKKHRVRDQKASGRCWIYATDRVLRSIVAGKGVKPTEMSTSFVNYHALRTSALSVLQKAAQGKKTALKPSAVKDASEGGFQPWAIDIIKEHGFVPKARMDTSADGAASGLAINELQRLVAAAQREFARVKKDAPDADGQRKAILARYEGEVDRLLGATIGAPPESFEFRGKTYTPQSFLTDYLKITSDDLDFVVLTHNPHKGFGRRRTVNMSGMSPFHQYNVSMPVIEKAVQDAVRQGQAVYVATNVSGDQPYRAAGRNIPQEARGILSLSAFKYENFIPQQALSKRDRLKATISTANHAMAITGFNQKGTKVEKWLVENSWGPRAGDAGHWHMYDDFFREYVQSVAVPRSVVPTEVLQRIDARAAAKAAKPKAAKPEAAR
jgi:bleomycin hydrolase